MGINDFNDLDQNSLAGSSSSEPERVGNVQKDWHTADTAAFADGSDLSDYGKLNEMRKQLVGALANADVGEGHRLRTLIINIDHFGNGS
jgi:hypothetical protein